MVNRVTLVGRLGQDPEMRHTTSGTPVTNFSLATNEKWKNQSGEPQERTEWHKVVTWNKLAEISSQYLTKGQLVFIEGRIQTREWDDRDGNKRYTTEIVASDMKMLGGRGDARPDVTPTGASESSPPPKASESSPTMDVGVTDDDIPF
ncbi:MAG: single-stranded DNA-binding protein [Acidobacteriota bacterium]|nr:single-stranded DNA-binding protein [Acidobacteriota bacterium]